MLDFIYWPVSWIMRMWYKLFELLGLGPESAITWVLAVVFLVFTLRAILYWPAVKQIRTTRQMQELQPQIKALQKKYKNDRQRMATEMQKLQKEHGFNPMLGCLPMLAQAPVFIGLFHVLRSFNRTGTRFGQENVCENIPDPAQCAQFNASLANYAFSPEDVSNFLHANIFGVPLSSYITQPVREFDAFFGFVDTPTRVRVAMVAVPLMIIAAIATHLNAKASVARQSPDAAAQSQAKIMNKLAVYIFPLGVLVSGSFLPIAILIYWVSNNGWTVIQQHYVFKKIEKEEDAKKERLEEVRSERAPKPGARPTQGKKSAAKAKSDTGTQVIDGDVVDGPDDSGEGESASDSSAPAGKSGGSAKPRGGKPGGGKPGGGGSGGGGKKGGGSQKQPGQKQPGQKQPGQKQPGQKQPGQKPKPGAQPQKEKPSQTAKSGSKGGQSGNRGKGGGSRGGGGKKGRR